VSEPTIICGDAREALRGLAERSVHCVVSSPPYWGLRDYGLEPVVWGGDLAGCPHEWGDWQENHDERESMKAGKTRTTDRHYGEESRRFDGNHQRHMAGAFCRRCGAWRGSLGLEPTPELFVEHIVEVMREVRRVLRDDGTLWLNMGDGYAANRGYQVRDTKHTDVGNEMGMAVPPGLKPKDLLLMPARVALALQADGWWLRSDIVWSKPNPMPESVTDRPTRSHEYVFLLAKSARYFYDADAIREPNVNVVRDRERPNGAPTEASFGFNTSCGQNPAGRNKRSVWEIATQPYPEAHFATFPEKLVEPCILAGTSEWGCCPECGAPWERCVEKERSFESGSGRSGSPPAGKNGAKVQGGGETLDVRRGPTLRTSTTGWRPTCDHEGEPVAAVVCDPFAGSGTVGVVAARLGRRAVLIDANPDYCEMARHRTAQMGLMVT